MNIIPSIASADTLRLAQQIEAVPNIPHLHIDIEDGNFIANVTFGMKTIRAIAAFTNKALDAHLMTTNPHQYIDDLIACGVPRISFHVNAVQYPAELLNKIHRLGGKAGIALNPAESMEWLEVYAQSIDYLLFMTAEPDDRGQEFNPGVLKKIERARAMLPPHIGIWADAGIGPEHLPMLRKAGVDTIIVGRTLWQAPDPAARYTELCALAQG